MHLSKFLKSATASITLDLIFLDVQEIFLVILYLSKNNVLSFIFLKSINDVIGFTKYELRKIVN